MKARVLLKILFGFCCLFCAQVIRGQAVFEQPPFQYTIISEENRTAAISVLPDYREGMTELEIPPIVEFEGKEYTIVEVGDIKSGTLTSVVIPNTVETIGDEAFCRCFNLANIDIPNSVTRIGKHAFHSCYSLTEISFPISLCIIDDDAFWGAGLKSVTLPESLEILGSCVFWFCKDIEEFTSLAPIPPKTAGGLFSLDGCDMMEDTKIYVPKESVELYEEAPGWKYYKITPIGGFPQSKVIGDVRYVVDSWAKNTVVAEKYVPTS